ncbi:hypothetical protein EG68_00518 [Paragonimus skrjabini miyazakii]|uniref:Ig-like domain-containing protein n=1 Tax=Paragonimus skrjabini miyazakii TaxID=59628 RepID=A0A8S9Z674_9TREM|nr:hypothetical protein EG68_00518 [Paragonimus skrjabini miyazakii]
MAGRPITFVCQVHGGKPVPHVHFYRLTYTQGLANQTSSEVKYFNTTVIQPRTELVSGLMKLLWLPRAEDNEVGFGCAATSAVISGRMLSQSVKLSVIFPPGPPILTAIPQTAISENRTRVFTCRSSAGSNPVAIVHWKLFTSVDYLTTTNVGSQDLDTRGSALDRLLTGTTTAHVFEPMQIADFDADPQPFPTANSGAWSNRRDSTNRGLLAYSEARLVGRPWYNGARVSCQLEWKFADSYTDNTASENQLLNLTDYRKPVYLTTEILFAPSAISLSVSPRNGIQEFRGHQVFECATTSSIPPSQITWLRRRPNSQQGEGADVPTNALNYAMFENPLISSKDDTVIEVGVSVETVPGLYGGKRVVSRLRLSNITREQDRSLLICKVDHVEWVKSVGRLHRIVVLFPPSLQIVTKQVSRNHGPLYSRSILKCVPEGGRPTFPFNLNDRQFGLSDISPPQEDTLTSNVNRPIVNFSQSMVNESGLWKFSWYFYPTYPDGLFSSPHIKLASPSRSTDIHQYGSAGQHPVLVLNQPERKQAGEYVCQLDGPGGRVQATTKLDFPFPPELIPSGITVFTAPVGYQAIIELYVWSNPLPQQRLPMVERYSTPTRPSKCERSKSKRTIAGELLRQERFNYSWFKVVTKNKTNDSQVLSRRRLVDAEPRMTQADQNAERMRVWSDVILVNLATIYPQQTTNLPNHHINNTNSKITKSIPTLVFRLFFHVVTETDYGEYMCELKHSTGRKTFLARLQPPVKTTPQVSSVQFTRMGASIYIQFDPKILQSEQSERYRFQTVPVYSDLIASGRNTMPVTREFTWMLVRICALYEPFTDSDVQIDIPECEIVHHNEASPMKQSTHTVYTNNCLDRLIEHPEKGTAMIHLAINHHMSFTNAFAQQPINSESPADASEHLPEDNLINEGTNTPVDWWTTAEQLVYQFRFYNMHGSLVHSSDWHIYKPEASLDHINRRPAMSLPLWLTLGAIVLIVIMLAVLVFLVQRKARRKRNMQQVIDHGCLSLKNPLDAMTNDLLTQQENCIRKQGSFYVANSSVVDSPCPLVGWIGRLNGGPFLSVMANQTHPVCHSESAIANVDTLKVLPTTIKKEKLSQIGVMQVNTDVYALETKTHKLWQFYHPSSKRQGSTDEMDSVIISPESSQVNRDSDKTSCMENDHFSKQPTVCCQSTPKSQCSPLMPVRYHYSPSPTCSTQQISNNCVPHSCKPKRVDKVSMSDHHTQAGGTFGSLGSPSCREREINLLTGSLTSCLYPTNTSIFYSPVPNSPNRVRTLDSHRHQPPAAYILKRNHVTTSPLKTPVLPTPALRNSPYALGHREMYNHEMFNYVYDASSLRKHSTPLPVHNTTINNNHLFPPSSERLETVKTKLNIKNACIQRPEQNCTAECLNLEEMPRKHNSTDSTNTNDNPVGIRNEHFLDKSIHRDTDHSAHMLICSHGSHEIVLPSNPSPYDNEQTEYISIPVSQRQLHLD